jgi:hypothetical protein
MPNFAPYSNSLQNLPSDFTISLNAISLPITPPIPMPNSSYTIPITQQLVKVISATNLNKLIYETYKNNEYDFTEWLEIPSGTWKDISVIRGELNFSEQDYLEEFKTGITRPNIFRILLKDLCNKGKLPPGTYFVSN